MAYLFLVLAFMANAGANILLKMAALRHFSFGALLRGEVHSAALIAASAVFLFGLNLCFYIVALEKIPLSTAYPIMIGMTFLITIGVATLLGEHISGLRLLGCVAILLGLIVAVRG